MPVAREPRVLATTITQHPPSSFVLVLVWFSLCNPGFEVCGSFHLWALFMEHSLSALIPPVVSFPVLLASRSLSFGVAVLSFPSR